MSAKIVLKPKVQLGVVTTHFKFVGGIVPDEHGKFPRDADGVLRVLSEMEKLRPHLKRAGQCHWSVSVLLPLANALPVWAETRVPAKRLKSRQPRFQSSAQARH